MGKYNSLKFLKETQARVLHTCDNCEEEIRPGKIYYRESIGRTNAPGIKLKRFCRNCYKKDGDKLLILTVE